MGKVRGLRARVHQAAVRPRGEAAPGPAPPAPAAPPAQASTGVAGGKEWALVSTDIFAGTKIDPRALVQTLDVDARSVAAARREIEAIKLAEQKQKEERKRRATAVVGDLHPLMEALPELLELETSRHRPQSARGSSQRRPTELHRMSAAQRLQLLEEERTRFQELLASPAYRASPLLAIGQRLADRMRLEQGGGGGQR
ncbi:ribosome biogenesis protein SLX9 homolog isoform X2 [Tamandua tetradactyla]|uniref:ribosome biogenesis protein SLX9 homolog isoform X2 n=1 Tax=Tamandua tetradactyla TaxID=48850 RepID=UPI004053B51F